MRRVVAALLRAAGHDAVHGDAAAAEAAAGDSEFGGTQGPDGAGQLREVAVCEGHAAHNVT